MANEVSTEYTDCVHCGLSPEHSLHALRRVAVGVHVFMAAVPA